jgi:hypothetical protein
MARINEYRMLGLETSQHQPHVITLSAETNVVNSRSEVSLSTPTGSIAGGSASAHSSPLRKKDVRAVKQRKEQQRRAWTIKRKTWDSSRSVHFDAENRLIWTPQQPSSTLDIPAVPTTHRQAEEVAEEEENKPTLIGTAEPSMNSPQPTSRWQPSTEFDELEKLLEASLLPKLAKTPRCRKSTGVLEEVKEDNASDAASEDVPSIRRSCGGGREGRASKRVVIERQVIDRLLDDLLSAAVAGPDEQRSEEGTRLASHCIAAVAATAIEAASTALSSQQRTADINAVALQSEPTAQPPPHTQTPGTALIFVFSVLVLLWWVHQLV